MSNLIESLGKLAGVFWEHGRTFLWGCAVASLLVFALLYFGEYLGFANAPNAFAKGGLWVLVAFVIFITLAIARTWEARSKRTLFFVPNEEQSLWGHARQTSGEVLTNLSFRMAVTNTSDSSVHLSKPHIAWPLRARWREHVTAVLMTQDVATSYVGQEFPISPHQRTHVSGVIALKGELYKAGKRMTFIVSVADHAGRRYRVKFRRVLAPNPNPV